jgi:hypothetical protein
MANEQAIQTLGQILNQINPNSPDKFSRIGSQIRDAKEGVISRYGTIFSSDYIDNLTPDEFKSFLLFKNNWHWDSLHRQSGWITADMSKLKEALKLLVDESLPIKTRLNRLRPSNGDVMVKGLGRAVITAILQVVFPDKYGVWNNTAEMAMKKLKLWPNFSRGATFGERYEAVNKVLVEVSQEMGVDLWTLDMLWWRVLTTHTPRGIASTEEYPKENIEKEIDVEPIEEEASSESIFALEKYLHEFLVDNWDKMELSNEWALLEEDGEIVGSRYQTGEVGEIDILTKHNTENKWLVIELKKNQTSDSTVGQILRYMSWARHNLVEDDAVVEGLIICHQIDRKLQYAIDGLGDIKCMTYQVNFKLDPTPDLNP